MNALLTTNSWGFPAPGQAWKDLPIRMEEQYEIFKETPKKLIVDMNHRFILSLGIARASIALYGMICFEQT